jgi:hypothetical protein
MADAAIQRASVRVKQEGGTLRKQLVAVFSERARRREGVALKNNFTGKDL